MRLRSPNTRVEEAAQASGVSVRTAYKWLARYPAEGIKGLVDRTSRRHSCPYQTTLGRHEEIVHLAIDDASRVASIAIRRDETARSACLALVSALRYYRSLGVTC